MLQCSAFILNPVQHPVCIEYKIFYLLKLIKFLRIKKSHPQVILQKFLPHCVTVWSYLVFGHTTANMKIEQRITNQQEKTCALNHHQLIDFSTILQTYHFRYRFNFKMRAIFTYLLVISGKSLFCFIQAVVLNFCAHLPFFIKSIPNYPLEQIII